MTSFYKCEINGTVKTDLFTCYAKAEYFPENGEYKTSADLYVENELIKYYDEKLSHKFGEIKSINIMDITPEEYYGMKKYKSYLFLE